MILLTIVHIVVCLFLIVIVLLQHGKGADIGASFGGSSQAIFGTEGPLPLLNKITTFSAIIFMLTSIGLAYLSANKANESVMSGIKPQVVTTTPATTTPAPAAPTVTTPPVPVTVPMPSAAVTDKEKPQTPTGPAPFPATETGRSH